MNLSNLEKQKVLSYIKAYFRTSDMPTETSEQRTAVMDSIIDFCTMAQENLILCAFKAVTEGPEPMIEDCSEEVKAWQEDENSVYYKKYNNKDFDTLATLTDILEHKDMSEVCNHIFIV